MRKSNLIAVLVLSLASMAWGQSNANGIGYFALEIPTDVTITIDGSDSDWSWFDPNFIVGLDQMVEIQKGETLDKSDFDAAIMTAWTDPSRDNRLYGFVRTTDDSLVMEASVPDDWWQDDSIEIIVDADASGGTHGGDNDWGRGMYGQQFGMHQVTELWQTPYGGDGAWWMGWQVVEEIHWLDAFPEARVVTEPPNAGTGSTNVTVNYEFSMPIWDIAELEGPENSIQHVFEAGQTIRLTYQLDEADNVEERRTHQPATTAEDGASGDCDVCSEYTLLAIGEYDRASGAGATAVEERSWGKIKATFKR